MFGSVVRSTSTEMGTLYHLFTLIVESYKLFFFVETRNKTSYLVLFYLFLFSPTPPQFSWELHEACKFVFGLAGDGLCLPLTFKKRSGQ